METVLTDEFDCDCGVCSPCRKFLKEYDKELGDEYFTLKYGRSTLPGQDQPNKNIEYKTRAQKDRERKDARRAERIWKEDPSHKDGGYWFHPDANHGTWTGYSSYYCRCPECFQFMSEFNKERKAKAKADATA